MRYLISIAILQDILMLIVMFLMFIWEKLCDLWDFLLDTIGAEGILIVVVCVIGIFFLVKGISKAGKHITDTVQKHDHQKKETAQIYQTTQHDIAVRDNDNELWTELDKNCRWLGFMDEGKWRQKLPNYVNKEYSSSFECITANFALQMEQQNITQNDDWFRPYLMYIVNHPGGSTATKMLNEVSSSQMKMTHATPDRVLLETRLEEGTKRVSKDVPPLFNASPLAGMNEKLYTPSKYAQKQYGAGTEERAETHTEELDFDDL